MLNRILKAAYKKRSPGVQNGRLAVSVGFEGSMLLGAHPERSPARRHSQAARLPKESGKGHSAGESAKASAVQTGSTAAAAGAAGGGHQRVGRKRSPAQSNQRAERKRSQHQKPNGHRHRMPRLE